MADKQLSFTNSIFLKIIGIITMTFDHFAKMVTFFKPNLLNQTTIDIFKIIGRISFPIFAFLVVEAMIHSKNKILYLLRLFLLSFSCDLIFFLVSKEYWGNPITTLFLGGLTIYFLQSKKVYIKLLAFIPIIYTLLISFNVIPLLAMYDLYGLVLILLFYSSIYLSKEFCEQYSKIYYLDYDVFSNKYSFISRKFISVLLLVVFTILVWAINPKYQDVNIFIDDPITQLYSFLAIIFLLIYNGKKGYNKSWIKYLFYLYFPLHLVVIYLFMII